MVSSVSESKLVSLFNKILFLITGSVSSDDADKGLPSLIIQVISLLDLESEPESGSEFISYINQIISLISSLKLESQPKPPETEFMSLIIQTKSLFNSMDLDSQPKPISRLISLFTELMNPVYDAPDAGELLSLFKETFDLKPEPELISLIYQMFYISAMKMNSNDENLIFICPQAKVRVGDHNVLQIDEEDQFWRKYSKWDCLNMEWMKFKIAGEGRFSYTLCRYCKGMNHGKATDKIKHPLHPKHSLQLCYWGWEQKRKCYCCDAYLSEFIYCCLACDFAMNMACVGKPQVLSIDRPKCHEHALTLFSRTTSLICDSCALVDSTSAVYICPPCGFVVHRRCIDLPRVIRISRHPHRISFTHSFSQGNLSCGVCRKGIHNDYGGYACIKSGCSYAAHSKCATQRNIWDGEELEGVPEEDIGDVEPFVRISDGVIRHFSHEQHHLRLDENENRDYNEDKLCQACITPIYHGNLYACMQCDFILHEACANVPRKMYHPIHPHLLNLVRHDGDVVGVQTNCSACPQFCPVGLFYECPIRRCFFKVHVQCGVISEPLVHASHMHHPLFLTSKPEERRECSICKVKRHWFITNETFNCIECEFSLCFGCATIPQKVRYKHDKHIFSLSYGNEPMVLWCEVCEGKIDTKKGFYVCDEDCCVTLHIECTLGKNLYMKPGSSWFLKDTRVYVVPEPPMTRPICSCCKKRCPKASFRKSTMDGSLGCSIGCMLGIHPAS